MPSGRQPATVISHRCFPGSRASRRLSAGLHGQPLFQPGRLTAKIPDNKARVWWSRDEFSVSRPPGRGLYSSTMDLSSGRCQVISRGSEAAILGDQFICPMVANQCCMKESYAAWRGFGLASPGARLRSVAGCDALSDRWRICNTLVARDSAAIIVVETQTRRQPRTFLASSRTRSMNRTDAESGDGVDQSRNFYPSILAPRTERSTASAGRGRPVWSRAAAWPRARVNTRKASPSRGLGRPGGITFRGAGKVGSD